MWYQYLNKSSLTPPDIIFKIVWPILYILMMISLIIFYKNYSDNFWISLGLFFFIIQLLLNLSWSLLFFTYHQILPSFFLIITIIFFVILTMKEFLKVNFTAGILLLPYLLWLIFASYLNLFIYVSN
jgi:tryptophan-rich sensory protein